MALQSINRNLICYCLMLCFSWVHSRFSVKFLKVISDDDGQKCAAKSGHIFSDVFVSSNKWNQVWSSSQKDYCSPGKWPSGIFWHSSAGIRESLGGAHVNGCCVSSNSAEGNYFPPLELIHTNILVTCEWSAQWIEFIECTERELPLADPLPKYSLWTVSTFP